MLLPLDMLRAGEWGEVEEVSGQPGVVGRLAELGVGPGCRLQVVQPGSPCLLNVSGCRLCLRPGECTQILVRPVDAVRGGLLMTTLDRLQPGQRAEVLTIDGEPGLVQRLYELGLMEGEQVELLALAPLGDPIEIRLGNSRLSLRRAEAAGVTVRLL